jgi:hypothetical protein
VNFNVLLSKYIVHPLVKIKKIFINYNDTIIIFSGLFTDIIL